MISNFSATALISDSEVPIVYTSLSYPPNRLVDRNRAVRANNPGLISLARQYAADPVYGSSKQSICGCDAEYCQYEGDEWDRVAWVYGRFFGPDGPPTITPAKLIATIYRHSFGSRRKCRLASDLWLFAIRTNFHMGATRCRTGTSADWKDWLAKSVR